jgi:hypothetical protein
MHFTPNIKKKPAARNVYRLNLSMKLTRSVRSRKKELPNGLIKAKPVYLRTSALYLSDSCVNGIPKSFAKSPENFKGSFFLKMFLIHQFSNLSYRLLSCVFK